MHTHTHTFTQGHTTLACRWHLGMLKLFCLLRGTDELVSCEPAAAAKSLQSCLTLCDPRDGSPPGSPVPGILQGRTLEWVLVSLGLGLKTNPRHSSLETRKKKKKKKTFRTSPPNGTFTSLQSWLCSRSTGQFSSDTQLCPTLCDPMD